MKVFLLTLFVATLTYANDGIYTDMQKGYSRSELTEAKKLEIVQRGLDFFNGCMEAISDAAKCGDLSETYVTNLKKLVR